MGLDSKKDVHLDGSSVGAVSRLEVLEGPSGQRAGDHCDGLGHLVVPVESG